MPQDIDNTQGTDLHIYQQVRLPICMLFSQTNMHPDPAILLSYFWLILNKSNAVILLDGQAKANSKHAISRNNHELLKLHELIAVSSKSDAFAALFVAADYQPAI